MSNNNVLVKYVRNADPGVSTGAINLGADREPLEIGGVGYLSSDEVNRATGYGAVLEPVDEQDARDQGLLVDPEPTEVPLTDQPLEDLRKVAKDEGVDIKGLTKKDEIANAISEARASVAEGQASLPATATTGPPAPVAPATTASSGSGSAA